MRRQYFILVGLCLCLFFFSLSAYAEIDIEKELIINVGQEVTETLSGGSGGTVTNKNKDIVSCTYVNTHQFLFKGLKRGLAEIKIHVPGYNYYYTVKVVDVISITLPLRLDVEIGEEYLFSPILADVEANSSLTWNSTNSEVASITNEGLLTAISEGSTTIICTAYNGISAQCLVSVKPITVRGVQLNKNQCTLVKGETLKLIATINPSNATEKGVVWGTSDEKVCMVTSDGIVSAMGIGTAIITAATIDGGFSASCIVTVLNPITSLTINNHSLSVNLGEVIQLSVFISPEDAYPKEVIWQSSNDDVAIVDNKGLVKGNNVGKAWIRALSEYNPQIIDSCIVEVLQPVTGIMLNETNIVMADIGQSIALNANVEPENATNKTILWRSSNESVCIVTPNGVVIAVGNGTAVIIATTEDGGFIATCTVTVNNTTGIVDVSNIALKHHPIKDILGRNRDVIKKGVNIIELPNGAHKKILVK